MAKPQQYHLYETNENHVRKKTLDPGNHAERRAIVATF